MTIKTIKLLGLDVGEKRIGYAIGDSLIKISVPKGAFEADGNEFDNISKLIKDEQIEKIVVGYPRNQKGEATMQTDFTIIFFDKLKNLGFDVVFQDESLTSVIAEDRLKLQNKPFNKSDIDAQAAAIILQDYIEMNYAK